MESYAICGPIQTYILVRQFVYVHLPINKHKSPKTRLFQFLQNQNWPSFV